MSDNVVSPIEVEAEIKQYTLVGDDIYIKRYTNENIPDWYRQLVSDIIAQDNTITDINAAIDYLSSLPSGYNQMITELQNADELINTSLESLVATTGSHTAAISNLQATKVDESSAAAIARTTIGAYFAEGSAGSWFNSQISTYASSIAANASSISSLSATLDGQSIRIDSVEQIAIDAGGWSAEASKMITAPDGSITGWQFADGTNVQSTFKIKATNFSVSDGTTGYTPFSITGSNVSFNGVVDFTNTNAYGTTTIDGGKITTGTITASQVNAESIKTSNVFVDNTMTSSNFSGVGGAGFRLKATGSSYGDPTIYGAHIRGSVVYADSLISSSITTCARNTFSRYCDDNATQTPPGTVLSSYSFDNSAGTGSLVVCDFRIRDPYVADTPDAIAVSNVWIYLYVDSTMVGARYFKAGTTNAETVTYFADNGNHTYQVRIGTPSGNSCIASGYLAVTHFKK